MRKKVLQSLVAYAIAAAIVWYAARGVSWSQVADAASHATLWLFVAVSLGGFLCWFICETILFSRLFSYFHTPTTVPELLPTMAAVYFLQMINSYIASGALVLFLHARKHLRQNSIWLKRRPATRSGGAGRRHEKVRRP